MPRISVIVPTYNRAHLVGEALQSLVAQTFDDWEALVVDDGSTDNTAEVVAGVGDGRIRYLRLDHGERSRARNYGLAEARGEFISFLDDDDLYLPHKMAAEVAFLQGHPQVDVACGGRRIVDHRGAVLCTERPWVTHPEPTLSNAVLGRCLPWIGSVALRRSSLGAMDHWFDPAFDLGEDTDFLLRLCLSGARFAWLPTVVSSYRLRPIGSLYVLRDQFGGYRQFLDKFFARDDLPAIVRASREIAYLRCRLFCACRAYAYRAEKLAQHELLQAVVVMRGVKGEAFSEHFMDILISIAQSMSRMGDDAQEYLDYVFARLPTPLSALQRLRGEALAALGVTEAVGEGNPV